MSWPRIKGLIRQDLYMTKREGTMWADLLFFSVINVLVFGLIALHFAGADSEASLYVLSGMLCWEIIRICQYTLTVTSLMNQWSHNLSNMFIAPVSLAEYVAGNMLSAAVKTFVVLMPLVLMAWAIFDFNFFDAGVGVVALAFVSLLLFASSLGFILLGLIFRFGVRVQALAWSAVYLFQPLIGVYFPLTVLPGFVQGIAKIIPATHAFQGVRNAFVGTGDVYGLLLLSVGMGIVGLGLAFWAFSHFYKRSMVIGQFARNDA